MVFIDKDVNGMPLPAELQAAVWDPATKVALRCYIDFEGNGTFVEIPQEDIAEFSMNDSVEGSNGKACSNKASITLHNYSHRYSPQKFGTYNPNQQLYNGPDQGDGRGNLRPKRRIRIHFQVLPWDAILIPLFEGHISGDGFVEDVGKGNENVVKIDALDYAKMLKDKSPSGEKVLVGGQYVDKKVALENMKICDNSDLQNSLIHRLVAFGDPDGYIQVNCPNNLEVVPFVPISKNIWSELAELADYLHATVGMYGRILYLSDSRFNDITVSDVVFNNSTVKRYNHKDETEKIVNKAILKFGEYKQQGRVALWMYPGSSPEGACNSLEVFTDPDKLPALYDPNVIFKAKYEIIKNTPIQAAGYVPGGSSGTDTDVENYEVLTAKNLGYEFFESNVQTSLSIFDISTLRDAAIIRANIAGRNQALVTKLVIYGEPVVQAKEQASFYENTDSINEYGEKVKEFQSKYMNRNVVTLRGQQMTKDLAWLKLMLEANSLPKRNYTFAVDLPLVTARSGTYVTLVEQYQGSEINSQVRLDGVSLKFTGKTSSWEVSFKAVEYKTLQGYTSQYTKDSVPREVKVFREPKLHDARDPAFNRQRMVPYVVGDLAIFPDGRTYIAAVERSFGETYNLSDWSPVLQNIAETYAAPDDVAAMTAKAGVDGVNLTWPALTGATPSKNPVGYIVQRSVDDGTSWHDRYGTLNGEAQVSGPIFMWEFDRATDGYPEKTANYGSTPLSSYRFRIKAVNSAGQKSANWFTVSAVDVTDYKTWKPDTVAGQSQTAGRSASVTWGRSTVYGLLRYEVQISLDGSAWYEPAVGLDVYASENNWRQGSSTGVKTSPVEQWNQELPLSGQGAGTPANTTYLYRVRVVLDVPQAADDAPNQIYKASDGKRAGPWSASVTAIAKATGATDVVAASITDVKIANEAVLVEKLSVLSKEYINNPFYSGHARGWGDNKEDGTGTSTYAVYDSTERAIKTTTGSNACIRSRTFQVDHNKIYRVDAMCKKDIAHGVYYIGLFCAAAPADGLEGVSVTGATGTLLSDQFDYLTGASVTNRSSTSDQYFVASEAASTEWVKKTFFIIGANRDVNDKPGGDNCNYIKLREDTLHIAIRVLNWSNSQQTTLFSRVSITDTGAGTVVAKNVYTENLAAIQGLFASIAGGGDDQLNFWNLSGSAAPSGQGKGVLRAGTADRYLKVDPYAAGDIANPYIQLVSGSDYIKLTSSGIAFKASVLEIDSLQSNLKSKLSIIPGTESIYPLLIKNSESGTRTFNVYVDTGGSGITNINPYASGEMLYLNRGVACIGLYFSGTERHRFVSGGLSINTTTLAANFSLTVNGRINASYIAAGAATYNSSYVGYFTGKTYFTDKITFQYGSIGSSSAYYEIYSSGKPIVIAGNGSSYLYASQSGAVFIGDATTGYPTERVGLIVSNSAFMSSFLADTERKIHFGASTHLNGFNMAFASYYHCKNLGRGDMYFGTQGLLPGYPGDYYPTIRVDGSGTLYFAMSGHYVGAIGISGSNEFFIYPNTAGGVSIGYAGDYRALKALSFTATSSRIAKKDIRSARNFKGLEMINRIDLAYFTYKEGDPVRHLGFIAEDTHPFFTGKNRDSMDIQNVIGALIKAVQELGGDVKKVMERLP